MSGAAGAGCSHRCRAVRTPFESKPPKSPLDAMKGPGQRLGEKIGMMIARGLANPDSPRMAGRRLFQGTFTRKGLTTIGGHHGVKRVARRVSET
jgi:hypothetical protein